MPSTARSFSSSANVVATMHPYLAPPRMQREGAFFGYELGTRRVVMMDFQLLKKMRIIESVVILVLGVKDHGKSALVKSLTLRLMALQVGLNSSGIPLPARSRLHDRKPNNGRGEYAPLADYLLSDTVELALQGSLNIVDPMLGLSKYDILSITVDIVEMVQNKPLNEYQVLALQVAVHHMLTEFKLSASPRRLEQILRTLNKQDLERYYTHIDDAERQELIGSSQRMNAAEENALAERMKRPTTIVEDEFLRDASIVGSTLNRLLGADYGGMFGSTRSMYDILSPEMVNYDWTGVSGKAAPILEYLMTRYDTMALVGNRTDLLPHFDVKDEVASAIKNLPHARARDEKVRKARAYSTTDINITQYPTDLTQVGEANSELRGLGQSIYRGMGAYFIGKQRSDDETLHELTKLGLSDLDAWFTTTLEIGCWGIVIPGQRVRWVQHILLPSEKALIESNTANQQATERVDVTSLDIVQMRDEELRRVDRLRRSRGAVYVGMEDEYEAA